MRNDWFVSEEQDGRNPCIYIESKSQGTICSILGRPLEERRAMAHLIAKAPALEQIPDLLAAGRSAVANYEWIIADHPDLDPDGDLPQELGVLKRALEAVKQAVADTPDLFEEIGHPTIEDTLDGLMAYDHGDTDSGISDPNAREITRSYLRSLTSAERHDFEAAFVRHYLTDEAISQGYGLDDVIRAAEWLAEFCPYSNEGA